MKKIILSVLLSIPIVLFGQNRLILNNNAYIVIDNSAFVVIENGNADAITTAGTGGNIVSEGESDVIKWSIGNNTGTYTIPWTTTPAVQGGNGTKIPLTVTFNNAGSNDGVVFFSTYETATDMNTAWPSDVTNMNSGASGGADGSLFAVDRFWVIDANTYSTKPDGSIVFTYDDAANEIAGSNTITEANLIAQWYNSTDNIWEGLEGTANAASNTVSPAFFTYNNFFRTWTLTDNAHSLPVDILSFNLEKHNYEIILKWTVTNEKNVSRYEIEKSIDGKNFYEIGSISSGNDSYLFVDFFPEDGMNYFRLKTIDADHSVYYTSVKAVFFGKDLMVNLFPNPAGSSSALLISNAYDTATLEIYNMEGKLVYKSGYSNEPLINLDLHDLSDGMYYLHLSIDDHEKKVMKMIKQK